MSERRRSICLIASGLETNNWRLQPWRYLSEVARQLSRLGHPVTVISDGYPRLPTCQELNGVTVHRLKTIRNTWWRTNSALQQAVNEREPDVILWHLGLTSLLHQRLTNYHPAPIVGIFTSPIYSFRDLSRIGLKKLISGYRLSAVHLLGALAPKPLLRWMAKRNCQLEHLVVQTQTTRQQLLDLALWPGPIDVISPGVDEIWRTFSPNGRGEMRTRLGYSQQQKIVVYFGSPAPLRGLPTLIHAFEIARRTMPSLEFLILSRRRQDELTGEDAALKRLLIGSPSRDHIKLVSGYLEPKALAANVATCDVVALPFELVPSDAPLSLLETKALARPLVTTAVACLPEMAGVRSQVLARPGDPQSLSRALLAALEPLSDNQVNEHSEIPLWHRSWRRVGEEWSLLIQNL